MASIQWTPPAGWVEETGAHVLMLAPCNCTATPTLVIGANAYTIVDGMGASFSTRGGVFATGALLEFVLDVDSKKAYLLSQAGLSTAPQKPKLLWEGSLTGGSITVPGFSDYKLFAVEFSASLILARVSSSGFLSVGEFNIDATYAGWGSLSGAVLSVSGDTLTLLHNFYVSVHETNWYQYAADQTVTAITKIYGLVRKSDIQEA